MMVYYKKILREFEALKDKAVIIVYGSVAAGRARTDSDIDIAILTGDKKVLRKAEKIADNILFQYGKVVSLYHLSPKKLKGKTPFINEILKGEVIYGKRRIIEEVG